MKEEGLRDASLTPTVLVSPSNTQACINIQSIVDPHTGCCSSFPLNLSSNKQLCHTAVHCGWSSWSEWGECLGPCGVQSVQWSFRSPNNPTKHGDGRTCRGIYRKARRYVALSSWDCFHYLNLTLQNFCRLPLSG